MEDNNNLAPGGEMVPTDELGGFDPIDTPGQPMSFEGLPDLEEPKHNRRATDKDIESLAAVLDVPVRVQAVLGRARMQIAELVSMRPGYVVELDRRVGEAIDILVNNRLIARGEIVVIDGALGVTLTEIVKQDA